MPRKTIKSLEDQLATVRQLRQSDCDSYSRAAVEIDQLKKRLSQVAAENEGHRMDIKWFKSLIQNLVLGGKDALPR